MLQRIEKTKSGSFGDSEKFSKKSLTMLNQQASKIVGKMRDSNLRPSASQTSKMS